MSLAEVCDEYWNACMDADPLSATILGDHRADDRMPDLSPEARESWRAKLADLDARLAAMESDQLAEADRITWLELRGELARAQDDDAADLDSFNVSAMRGPQITLGQLPDFQPLDSAEACEDYLARLNACGPWLDQQTAALTAGLERGRTACVTALDRVLRQLTAQLETPAADWGLVQHVARAAAGGAGAATRATAALDDALIPALRRYHALLAERVAPAARPAERPGLVHLEGGAEAYARLARKHTSTDRSPEEIHQQGLAEVARLREEIAELGQVALGVTSFPEVQRRLREDPSLYFADPAGIVAAAEGAIRRAERASAEAFGLRPEGECEVKPIPAAQAPDSTVGYYWGPSADGSRPGAYYVNTYAPETRARFEAEVLAFHEAVPGHHFQISLAQGLDDLPTFRRFGGVTAYVEGWALYAETLSDELGLYSGDLERLGARFFDIKRACRLVVDSGLHALGWARDRARDYMVENSLMHGPAVETEVDRYIVMPGQALAYKTGQLEILRLRDEARGRLGERFDLAGFHDRVLEAGALSLPVLADRVRAWGGGAASA